MTDAPRKTLLVHWILVYSVIFVAIASGYKYVYAKNYDFLVEVSCDPTVRECYSRDCDDGYCPPNNLSTYRVFRIPASQFAKCDTNECSDLCDSGKCLEDMCSSQTDIECVGPSVTRDL